MTQAKPTFVKVVRRPLGEAPEWVRDAWIGLTLPLCYGGPIRWFGFGVLSGPTGWLGHLIGLISGKAFRINGYVIDADQALQILRANNSAAADWWISNAPYLFGSRRRLMFDAESCEAVPA